MGTLIIERVGSEPCIIGRIVIAYRRKSDFQLRLEQDLDYIFESDIASDIIYHRSNGRVVELRGYTREEFFEAEPGSEGSVGMDAIVMKVPSHKMKFQSQDGDWLEFEGITYKAILSKKRIGGITEILLHQR